jgi:hypothetical protein
MNTNRPPLEKNEDGFKKISRRRFIRILQYTGIGALIGWKGQKTLPTPPASQSLTGMGGQTPSRPFFPGRLVHVYDSEATSWDYVTGWYGYYVDQNVVDAMMEEGLLRLTSAKTVASAWKRLLPNYTTGQTFAIKVNSNNYSPGGPDPDPEINALIEPVNALIRTLLMFGVQPAEIYVYDVNNGWHSGALAPLSFISRCLYPGVNFVSHYGNPDPFSSTEFVKFNPPGSPSIPDLAIGNVVVDADYLINMFIPKAHSLAGVTLGFKNHLGSINQCERVHVYLPYHYYYNPSYSTLLDILMNPHFAPKTVLNICDGLFGSWAGVGGAPPRWITFGNNAPKSIFLSTDPVAIDSVLTDFIEAERIQQGLGNLINGTRDYLLLAESEGLGVFDEADPWILPIGSDYKNLKYIFVPDV